MARRASFEAFRVRAFLGWAWLEALPQHVQELARANFELLKENPFHPSLHFKPSGMDVSVVPASVSITGRWAFLYLKAFNGSGLEAMPSMTVCCANIALQPTGYSGLRPLPPSAELER